MFRVFLFVVSAAFFFADAHPNKSSIESTECVATNVYVTYASGFLYVSWTAPSACPAAKDYRIMYRIKDNIYDDWFGPLQPIAPGVPMTQVDIRELFCERVSVVIETIDENESFLGETNEIELERTIPAPDGLLVENTEDTLKVKWKPIWDPSNANCRVLYIIKYGDGDPISTDATDYELSYPSAFPFCSTQSVEIQASSNEYYSELTRADHQINIPPVQIVNSGLGDDGVSIEFEPFSQINPDCGAITYQVIEKDQTCFSTEFKVKAIGSNGFHGDDTARTIQKPPGTVNNLIAEVRSNEIHLEWNVPYGAEKCSVRYEIDYEDDILSTHSTSINIPVALASCVGKSIQVAGIVNEVKGSQSEVRVYGNIAVVNNLQCAFSAGQVLCSWEKPSNSDTCEKLQYQLTYYADNVAENQVTEELSISLPDMACPISFVTVRPILVLEDGSILSGIAKDTIVQGCFKSAKHTVKLF